MVTYYTHLSLRHQARLLSTPGGCIFDHDNIHPIGTNKLEEQKSENRASTIQSNTIFTSFFDIFASSLIKVDLDPSSLHGSFRWEISLT